MEMIKFISFLTKAIQHDVFKYCPSLYIYVSKAQNLTIYWRHRCQNIIFQTVKGISYVFENHKFSMVTN